MLPPPKQSILPCMHCFYFGILAEIGWRARQSPKNNCASPKSRDMYEYNMLYTIEGCICLHVIKEKAIQSKSCTIISPYYFFSSAGVRLLTTYRKFIPAFSATLPSEPYSLPTIRHSFGLISASGYFLKR